MGWGDNRRASQPATQGAEDGVVLSLWEIRKIEHGRHVADTLKCAELRHAAGHPWSHLELLRQLYSDFDAKHAPKPERYWVLWIVIAILIAAVVFIPGYVMIPATIIAAVVCVVRLVFCR